MKNSSGRQRGSQHDTGTAIVSSSLGTKEFDQNNGSDEEIVVAWRDKDKKAHTNDCYFRHGAWRERFPFVERHCRRVGLCVDSE